MALLPFASPPIQNTAVTPGSYTNTNLTVNQKGQITAASNGSGGGTTNNFNTRLIDQTGGGTTTYGALSGTVNGSNALFTVSNGAYVSGSLQVQLNGQVQTLGSTGDFTETTPGSGTFTFATAPPTSSIVIVSYLASSPSTSSLVQVLSTTTGINAKNTGTTTLYTVPTGKTAVVTEAIVRCTAASSISSGPTLGVGVASGEDDIFTPTALTALTTTAKIFGFVTVGMSVSAAAAALIKVGIDSAATGTSQVIAIDLMGYLL